MSRSLRRSSLLQRYFQGWFLVPGIMGLFFITAPYLILKIGAVKVFVAVVFGQIFGSLLWDRFMEDIPIDRWRVMGCLLTLAGASLFAMSDSGF